MSHAADLVRYQRDGALALLTLDRPAKLNAINAAMIAQLHAALDRAEADPAVRAIVIAGAGRAFSGGFDLASADGRETASGGGFDLGSADDLASAPGSGSDPRGGAGDAPDVQAVRRALEDDFRIVMRFWDCPKPTVAAVHGYCLGSAMELAVSCDVTVAADDCLFGAPEVRFGSGIVAMVLPWLIAPKLAKELLLTGDDRVSAQRALEMGLVNRVVPAVRVLDEARAVAARIAANDEQAVRLTKLAIQRSIDAAGLRTALRAALELDIVIETTQTPESREFGEILKREGAKAAVAWRSARAATGRSGP
jgi:enoyl-CoA hydratase